MKYEVIQIDALGNRATLACYEHVESPEMPEKPRKAMLVLPGGAYAMCSDREAEPVAMEFFVRGYNAYVLRYPCAPARYPVQLVAAAASVHAVRARAKEANTDPKKVYAVGFSAGGHLCGTLANCPDGVKEVEKYDFRPNAVILAYPVISYEVGHEESFDNLLGERKKEDCAWLSLEHSVTEKNPPAFIWTTANDQLVPAENSLRYAAACMEKKVKYELHIYDDGPHGLSVASEATAQFGPEGVNPKVATWIDFADKFLRKL